MPFEGVDANIPLQAGRNLPVYGPNYNALQTMLRIQQEQQVVQAQNALRALYSNDANFDPKTMQPTSDAWGQLMRVSPAAGLDLRNKLVGMQQKETALSFNQGKVAQEYMNQGRDIAAESLAAYQNYAKTMPPEAARQRVQEEIYTPSIENMMRTMPPEMAQRVNRNFDPQRANATLMNAKVYEGQQAQLAKQRAAPAYAVPMAQGGGGTKNVPVIPDGQGGWETADEPHTHVADLTGMHKIGASGAVQFESAKDITILDKDGAVVQQAAASQRKDQPGWYNSIDGSPIDVPQGGRVVLGKQGAGRLAATQIQTIIGSANEAVGELRNLMELPSTATSGIFMGVQAEHPDSLAAGIRRVLANKITPQAAQDLKATFLGMSRSLAAIEGQGARTGMVGLSKQMEGYLPQAEDTGPTVLRKYASMRQVLERGIDTMLANPEVAGEQRKLLQRALNEARDAVPFTVHDVNELERGEQKKKWWESGSSGISSESVKEFANRVLKNKKVEQTSTPLPGGGAEAPIPPAPMAPHPEQNQNIEPGPKPPPGSESRAAPPIDVVPMAKRQDGKVVTLKDDAGMMHRFVVTGNGKSLMPADGR